MQLRGELYGFIFVKRLGKWGSLVFPSPHSVLKHTS